MLSFARRTFGSGRHRSVATSAAGLALAWFAIAHSFSDSANAQRPEARPRPEVEAAMVDLTSRGFEPPTLSLSAGKVAVSVRDRLYLGELELALERVDETRRVVLESLVSRRTPANKWQEYLELQPGRYRLVDARFPEWQCDITVTDRK